ncbi:MAG: MBG domain-containing protein [Lysobacteraceae bacterium]
MPIAHPLNNTVGDRLLSQGQPRRLGLLFSMLAMLVWGMGYSGISKAVTYTWTGASSDQWSEPSNWNPIGVPGSGDTLAFPGTASNKTNSNDLAPGTSLAGLALNGSGYTLNGNGIVLTQSIASPSSNIINLPIDVQTNAITITGYPRINGALSGSGSVTLGAVGQYSTPSFAGVSSYSGTISLAYYSMTLDGAALPSAAVTNGNGALSFPGYIYGNGTIGSLSNLSGRYFFVYPGSNGLSGTGILNTGSVTLNNGGGYSRLYFDLNGAGAGTGYDQIAVTGSVALGNARLNLTAGPGFVPALGDEFVLIDNDGADAVSATLRDAGNAQLLEGGIVTLNGYQFVFSYVGGDGNDITLTSQSGLPASTTSLLISPSPSDAGELITLSATVAGGGSTPTGTVTFFDGLAELGSAALDGAGVASLSTSALVAGSHSLVARYNGSGSYGGSSSGPVSHTVRAVFTVTPNAGAGGSLTPSTPQSVVEGQDISFTVAANPGYALQSISGCDGSLSGSSYTTGAVVADCEVVATFEIAQVPSTTLLSSVNPGQSYVGQSVTVNFSVFGDTPTGTVTISSDIDSNLAGCTAVDATLGSCVVDAGVLTVGQHQFSAHYSGDAGNLPSDSGNVAHRVVQPVVLYRDDAAPLSAGKGAVVGPKALIAVGSYPTVAAALAAANDGDEVVLGADTYLESDLHIAVNNLTVRGNATAESDMNPWTREPVSFIDGSNAAQPLIWIDDGVTGTVLQDLGLGNVRHNCVQGLFGNSGTMLERNLLDGCRADQAPGGAPLDPRAGVFFNGPVDNMQFIDNEVTDAGPRGLLIWNGFKTNIVFDGNYVHDLAGCCGIELQDGTASGVQITGNRIERSPDNAIGVVGLTGGSGAPFNGANLIANNFILNAGRFGIEVKLPNGSGLDSGDGSIVVEGNDIYLTSTPDANFDGVLDVDPFDPGIVQWRPAEVRDLAGIAVMRRSVADANNVDVPSGVVVRNNTVGGYQQNNGTSSSTGFGIVLGGVKHTVFNNTLLQNDVGIQRQAGHTPYCDFGSNPPPQAGGCDGDQSDLVDDFFGRDNSQLTCVAIGSNTYGDSVIATSRDVVAGSGVLVENSVFNSDTGLGYCSLQAAIDDPLTQDGHTLVLGPNVYPERVVIDKQLTLQGAGNDDSGMDPVTTLRAPDDDGAGGVAVITVRSPDVRIENLLVVVDFDDVAQGIRAESSTSPAFDSDGLDISSVRLRGTASGDCNPAAPTHNCATGYGFRNAIQINPHPSATYQSGPVAFDATVSNSVIESAAVQHRFRAGIDARNVGLLAQSNDIVSINHDVYVNEHPAGRMVTIGGAGAGEGNSFHGFGVAYYAPSADAGDAGILNNQFVADSNLPGNQTPMLWGDFSAVRLIHNAVGQVVSVSGNTFSGYERGVLIENFPGVTLSGNSFAPLAGSSTFQHVRLSNKELFSGAAPAPIPGSLTLVADSNTFIGSGGTAVYLLNDNAQLPADADHYGSITFSNSVFDGALGNYFELSPLTCVSTNDAGCPLKAVYDNAIGNNPANGTPVAPFGGDVDATTGNTFGGIAPSSMDYAQYQDTQSRTYHNDPNAPESPAAPGTMGIVNYGFDSNLIPTTTTIVSTSPEPSAIGAPVTVTVNVVNALNGVPAGSITVVAPDSTGCNIPDYPTSNSCAIAGNFSAGGTKTVTATFSPSDTVNQGSAGNDQHTVTFGSGATVPVVPTPTPTPTDNDYTRIDNAIQAAGSGVTIVLTGDFDWTEANAYASWERGSDGVIGTSDDWSSHLPGGVGNVIVRASAPGAASIQGNEGTDPDDFAAFLYSDSQNQNWTFENLTVRGFDIAFAMFGSGSTGLSDNQYLNNRIEIGPDSGDDYANYGIYSGFGANQTVAGNDISIDITGADGDPLGDNSRAVAMQIGDSCNNACFDGLLISSNTVTVSGVPGAMPPRVIGIWENAGDVNSSIYIEDNAFTGSGDFGTGVANNNQTALIASTQSNGAKQSAVTGNSISAAAFGLRSQLPAYGHYIGSDSPLLIEGNTFLDNGTALHLHAAYPNAGQYTLRANRIFGNVTGLFAERADDLPLPGAPGYGGDELPSSIDADDNWWGCNAGPSDADCDPVVIESEGVPADDPANVTLTTWLQLRASATPVNDVANIDRAIDVDLVSSSDGTTVATAFPDATGVGLTTSKATFNPAAPFATVDGAIATNLEGLMSGIALMNASLDNQAIDFYAMVGTSVTVNDNVDALETLPAGADCGAPDFSSIQAAIDAVPVGTEILVCAGTYVEGDTGAGVNLAVDKPVTLRGAQSGIDARNRADAGASIIYPAHANAAIGYAPNATFASLVDVLADDVTIDGFLFDGDNPGISSGLPMGAADPDVDGGMQIANASNVDIRNNVVRNLVYSGIEAYSYPLSEPVSEGNVFHRNWVHNLDAPSDWGIGIIVHYNFYAAITENLVSDVRIGFQTGNHTKPIASPATDALVSGNAFVASATGIYHNAQYSNASPFTISGNSIEANLNPAQDGMWIGFALGALNNSTTAAVLDNDVDGNALAGSGRNTAGYRASLISTTLASSVSINGGSVSNVMYGVMATDGAYFAGAQDDVLVQNVSFSDIGLAALWVEDTALAGGETVDHSPRLTVGNGNSFSNVPYEGALSGPLARIEFAGGAPLLQTVLVRAAGDGHRGASPDSNGNVRSVMPGIVNDAIADAAISGVVTLEAGDFPQNVVVNKSVTVNGPFAGVPGHDAGRDGTGEAVLNPASGRVIQLQADGIRLDGLTLASPGADLLIGSGQVAGGGDANNVEIVNNRLVDSPAVGIYIITSPPTRLSNWTIDQNLFSNLSGASTSAINFWYVDGGIISDNVIDSIDYAGIQLDATTDTQISGNSVSNVGAQGIQLASGVANVSVHDNTLNNANTSNTAHRGAIRLYADADQVSIYCNSINVGTGLNGLALRAASGPVASSPAMVFHNRIIGADSAYSERADGPAIGSNWYGGGSATVAGSEAGSLLVANPLPADPTNGGAFDVAACGDNTPVELVIFDPNGTPQSAELNQPFDHPLSVRVQDALGGAVMGESVTISSPASGASALLTPASGSMQATDYNGVVQATAIANGFAGTYDVVADHASNDALFELTNIALQQVQFDLNGPVAGVEVGDEVAYTGFIGNDNTDVTENVYVHIEVSATVASLDPADLAFCVVDPMMPTNCIPLVWTDNGSTLSLDFTDLSGFPITAPYAFLHNFRAVFGEAGVYSVSAQVIGATSGTVYANDSLSTEVVAQHAGVTLDINGPVAGVEKDVPTAYSATLSNDAADVADNVLVEFVLTRTGNGGDIGTGDVLVEYDTGGGVFAPIPLTDDGNQLTGLFGPPGTGFPLPSGYSATTDLRVTYYAAPDTFTVAATVIDANSDTDGVPSYAADNLSTDVVLADPDVSLEYDGPFAMPESVALVGATVGKPVYYRSRLENHGIDDVADSVYAPFSLTADYSLSASDVSVLWWPADPTCGPSAPGTAMALTLTEDGSGGLEGMVGAPSFTLNGGEVLEVCYEVVFAHVGEYSTAAEIADAGADTDGYTTYAATNLSTLVGAGDATIVLSDLGPIVYDGNPHAATASVTATVSGDPLTVTVDITYDGSATAPTDAGSYAVLAVVNDADWEGSASGTLVIDPAPATVSFSDLSHVYDGSAKAATATIDPVGVTGLSLAYAPVSSPVNVGSYDVTATLSNPNYVLTGTTTATLEITAAASGVSVSGATVTYDGMPHAVTVTNPNGESYSVSYVGTDVTYGPTSSPPINAGNYEATVTVTDPNYTGGPFMATLTIDPANVDVTLDNLNQVYDGGSKPVGVSTTPAGVAVVLSYAGTEADGDPYGPSATAPSQAGTYAVTVMGDSPNYALGTVTPANPATLTIAKATAVINFTQLNFVASGGPQAAQYTVAPTGMGIACTETYTPPGDSTVPVDPGSYQVDVACSGPNHEGAASATMNIASAPAATLEIVGASSFNGIAGATLPSPGPTVRVLDGNSDPVEGASIAFSITAGDGSVTGAVVATDINGEAEVGGWTLDADSSASNGLEASVVGRADITAVAFTATGDEQADLSILKTSDTTAMRSGDSVDYLITVENAGPSHATSADVVDALPVELDAGSATWICIGGGGSSCSMMNGSGDIDVEVSIPVGGSVTLLLSATADFDSSSGIDNTAMVELTSGDDPNVANDLSTWSIGILPPLDPAIFKDGFEGDPRPLGGDGKAAMMSLDLDAADLDGGSWPRTLLTLPASNGEGGIVVRGFCLGKETWLRLEGRKADGMSVRSDWMRVEASTTALIGWQAKPASTDFVIGTVTDAVMLRLNAGIAPMVVQAKAGVTVH